MASSSSSSSNQITQSTSNPRFDVFLSFRGPDTRNGFISHLCDALKQSGFQTFIDNEELRGGSEIKPELRKAIRESKMCIIVFSKNYAASKWCLDELVEILECRNTMGQVVLPVFYDVEPCVVRSQRESYALDKYNKKGDDFDQQRVNSNEAKLIKKIVKNVGQVVGKIRCLNLPENLVGIESHVECIKESLNIGSDRVRIIGIFGMGGVGKTTVSKAVYNSYAHLNHFDSIAFVENIKEVSKTADGLLHLQERLLSQLEKKDIKLPNRDEGIHKIKMFCCSKRTLILLDDLDDFEQIQSLAGHKRWFGAGSRVIVVTRDADLLRQADMDGTYKMEELGEDESLELFRWHAVKEGEFQSKDHELLWKDLAKNCGGLPLALEVIGRHLRGKNLTYWKNALKEFQSKPHETVHKRLKISYDGLSKDGKDVFLDAACLFIGRKREFLTMFWSGCGFPENSDTDLTDKCLFKFDEKDCLVMHDLLRDMGREIVVEASDRSLEKQSRLWIPDKVIDVLSKSVDKEKIAAEGIILDSSKSESVKLDAHKFEMMHRLRFLQINDAEITGSLEHIFRELRWLTWYNCPMKEGLPVGFHPRHIVGLDMKYNKFTKLWEGVKQFDHLKFMDLSKCEWLEETPDFSGTKSLERLILTDCKRLQKIHLSICNLTSLVEFQLGSCESLKELPEQLGNMVSLQTLNLCETLITELPASIGRLSSLVSLRLDGCQNLKALPTSICSLRSLQELNLYFVRNLQALPQQLGDMESLQTLTLTYTSITKSPDSIGQLHRLVSLQLLSCKGLKTLPTSICNLNSLQELNLEECWNLQQLPEQLGDMKCLLHLNLRDCPNIKHLPESICNSRSLQSFSVTNNHNLHRLPNNLGELICLLHLDIGDLDYLTNLPASICNLTALQTLNLGGYFGSCSELECLPEELGNLELLVKLNLYRCEKLSCLPASTCNLRSLQQLNVSCCSNLKELPGGLGSLKSLRILDASFTPLQELPDSIRHLTSLVELSLNGCKNLNTLPDSICDLSSLQKLETSDCCLLQKVRDPQPNELAVDSFNPTIQNNDHNLQSPPQSSELAVDWFNPTIQNDHHNLEGHRDSDDSKLEEANVKTQNLKMHFVISSVGGLYISLITCTRSRRK